MSSGHIAFYMHDLSGGGVERMRLALIAELRLRGVRVTLLVGQLAGPLSTLLPADLDVIDLASASTLQATLPLIRAIRRLRPSILVSSLCHNNIAAVLAVRLARVETRVIMCQHNALSMEAHLGWQYRVVPALYRVLQRWADGIIAVSDGVANDLADITGIARRRITVIHNPIIAQDFPTRAAERVTHPWLIDAPVPVLVFAGRLTEQKNPALLIEAFALLTRKHAARLLILGDGPLLDSMRDQVARLGLDDIVEFAGFQTNPLPWIMGSACLVLTSHYEGFGNVLIEAMACGTAVVATDCPHGPREALQDGRFGELVACGDTAGLAAAMQRALGKTHDKTLLRARAALFTASSCADAHLALFARLDAVEHRQTRPFGLAMTRLSAASVIEKMIKEPSLQAVSLVVTPNIDHVRLLRQKEFAAAYEWAKLVCPDGLPVLAYARLRGNALHARVTGCDLFACLASHAELRSRRTFIVVESRATEVAARRWAKAQAMTRLSVFVAPLQLSGDPAAQSKLVQAIRAARPDFLVMTLGAPFSEVFVHQHRHDLPPCWALCVGQAFRIHLQLARRAPLAWQGLGLEWLWRLAQEPRRLSSRYARSLAWFPVAILRDILRPAAKLPSGLS